MVIARIKGGLGNQLFQYAAGYSLAKRLSQPLCMDASFFPHQTLRGFKLSQLNLKYTQVMEGSNILCSIYKNRYLNKILRELNVRELPCGKGKKYLLETRSDIVSEYFTIEDQNVYLDGYYQSENYFGQFRKELIKQFTPKYDMEQEYRKLCDEVEKCCSVAVHVRRGDFLQAQNDPNPNHYLLSKQYYRNALQYFEGKLKNCTFYWFSDDIDWVKTNFGEREHFRYIRLNTLHADIDEMMLMKSCHHIIAANSTFSWWASWMNENEGAIHVCPSKRYGNLHMIPGTWIKIEV